MKNKFVINADHFSDKISKTAYIKNHTDNIAIRHLISHMKENHSEKFIIVEEIFVYLKNIYEDSNKLENVKNDYRYLIMRNDDEYHTFVIKFLHLTDETQIFKNNYKENFLHKLSFNLQQMIAVACINCITFQEIQKICARTIHYLKEISNQRSHFANHENRENIRSSIEIKIIQEQTLTSVIDKKDQS